MINVLSVVSELNFGGGENRILNLARAIDTNRFRHQVVRLYSPDPARARQCGSMLQQFAEAGVELHDLGVAHPGGLEAPRALKLAHTARTLGTAIARLRRLILESRTDVVDAHLETALYTAIPAAASARVPVMVTLYSPVGVWKYLDGDTYRRFLFPPLRRLNLRLCSAIMTDSRAGAQELKRFVGPGSPPVHVCPNGVRLPPSTRPRHQVLAELGIPEDTRATILGQVAGLVPYKGQTVLLEAARRVVEAGHHVYVLCIGDARQGPEYPNRLRKQAEALGIADRVRIKAWPGNIADVWNVIDVHVHPSTVDSLPNAVIEGMSFGKPAVLSSVGAIPDHVDHGRTGLIVPPEDPGALAEAIKTLLEDRTFAAQLGRAAHERYLERFTPEVTARQMQHCFEQLSQARIGRRTFIGAGSAAAIGRCGGHRGQGGRRQGRKAGMADLDRRSDEGARYRFELRGAQGAGEGTRLHRRQQ